MLTAGLTPMGSPASPESGSLEGLLVTEWAAGGGVLCPQPPPFVGIPEALMLVIEGLW